MREVVMQLIGLADGRSSNVDGMYLKSFDPNGREGRGEIVATPNPEEAMRFESFAVAMELWKTIADPPHDVRPDGRPNRPLTAYSVTTEYLSDATGNKGQTHA